jgi:ribosomal protein S3
MLMLFIFPFDVQLLATIIAQELARLRQFHKYYLDFIKKTLSYGLAFFGKKYLYGLKIVIKGQLTSYRRRMKRSQLIAFRIGNFLKSHQEASVLFAFERSFNRYGILGVSVSAQFRSLRKHFTGYIENSKSINKSLLKNLTSGFLKNPNLYLSE